MHSYKSPRANRVRTANFESLERRELMAVDGISFSTDPTGLAKEWAEEVLISYQARDRVQSAGPYKQFESENAARDFIVSQVASAWRSVLGKPLSASLAPKYMRSPFDNDWAVVNRAQNKNIQVTGVDEADSFALSKDGFLFVRSLDDNQLRVIDARDPKNLQQVASIEVGYSSNVFLSGNSLVVLSQPNKPDPLSRQFSASNYLRVFDVSVPSNPQQTSHLQLNGRVSNARLVGDRLTMHIADNRELLKPLFFSDDPTATYQTLTDQVIGHFESDVEFAARIRPQVIEWISGNIISDDQTSVETADWEDLIVRDTSDFSFQSSLLTFQLTNGSLSFSDSKVIVDSSYSQVLFTDTDSIYTTTGKALFAFHVDSKTVELEGIGESTGYIRDSRMVDEYNGYLRVLSHSGDSSALNVYRTASGKRLEIVGQLRDIAPGERLLGVHFFGENAVVTTGNTGIDPLHIINISNPTNPIEVSEIEIPGFSTFLKPVGENLVVGAGFIRNAGFNFMGQISLYDVSDLKNPRLIDTWQTPYEVYPSNSNLDALAFEYDAASGLLTVPPFRQSLIFEVTDSEARERSGVQIFKIDVTSNNPLKLVAQVGEEIERATIVGDTMVAISNTTVQAYELGQGTAIPLDAVVIANPNPSLSTSVAFGRDKQIDLVGTSYELGGRVTSVGTSLIGAKLLLSENGRTLTYFAPEKGTSSAASQDYVKFTVTYPAGEVFESSLQVSVVEWSTTAQITSDLARQDINPGNVELTVQFVNDNGKTVSNLKSGHEYWLQLMATDLRNIPLGVQGAWVNLAFAGGALTAIGSPEGMDRYTTTVRGEIAGGDKILSLGALSNYAVYPSKASIGISRIRVRAGTIGEIQLDIQVAAKELYESRLDRENVTIDASRLSVAAPKVKIVDSYDTNADGGVTPLDALILVEQLSRIRASGEDAENSQLPLHQLDISGDGAFTPWDVLVLVDFLARQQIAARRIQPQESIASMSNIDSSTEESVIGLARRSGTFSENGVDNEMAWHEAPYNVYDIFDDEDEAEEMLE